MSDPPPLPSEPPPGQSWPPQTGQDPAQPSGQLPQSFGQPQSYGQPPPPPYGQGPQRPYGQGPPESGYPQQELLPQDVQHQRSRMPIYIGLAVVLALIAGGGAAWLLLRDDGESTRAQYCAEIKTFAPNDDLIGAVTNADASMVDQAKKLADLAPETVVEDWTTLSDVVTSVQSSATQVNPSLFLTAIGALRNIVSDSNANCGTAYTLPFSG